MALVQHERHDDGGHDEARDRLGHREAAGATEERLDELVATGQQTAGRERHGEDDADDRFGGQARSLLQGPDDQRAEQQGGEPAEHGMDVQQDRHADARQSDVRDGVGRERHPSHHGEAADETSGDPRADCDDHPASFEASHGRGSPRARRRPAPAWRG